MKKLISVIMPTIQGREASFAQMQAAYRDRSAGFRLDMVVLHDLRNWATACNEGMKLAKGPYLHFTSDDLEPLEGWADAMVGTLDAGEIPAPQLWDHVAAGPPVNAGDGPIGATTEFSRVVALTRDMADRIGPWPELDYYSDNWVSDAARKIGIVTRVTAGYHFIHHWHPHGRLDGGDWVGRNYPLYVEARNKL